MKNKFLISFLIIGILFTAGLGYFSLTGNSVKELQDEITIYKSQNCGCCSLYTNYMKSKAETVKVVNLPDLFSLKRQYDIPSFLESCHTTIVEDYFVEGHIPFEAIKKLISEKPDIKGIAMPGMPQGSPGMPGAKNDDFVIYAVKKDGSQEVFMTI